MDRNTPAKIILIDIETAPNLSWVWGKWEQNVLAVQKDWYILSYAVKTLGAKSVKVHALPDYPGYAKNKEDDAALVQDLWATLDSADIVIGHNSDAFDLKKSNARFLAHGLKPPRPYKSVDTLKISRKHFKQDSNKLDDLGKYLGVGRKIVHTGFNLWSGCMRGDVKSWAQMRRYNAMDVALLERVYLKLRPWSTSHPNLSFYSCAHNCPVCQSEELSNDGFTYTRTTKKQRKVCCDCGHRFVDAASKVLLKDGV